MSVALPVFLQLATSYAPAVAPETLAALAQYESGLNPLTIHDNTTAARKMMAPRKGLFPWVR